MLLQVHDELVFEVPGPEIDAVKALVRAEMEGAASLSVPLVVDTGVGKNWLETKIGLTGRRVPIEHLEHCRVRWFWQIEPADATTAPRHKSG